MSASDLRRRLAAAIANPGNPGAAVTAELYGEEADAALAVFADWLRERAAKVDEGTAMAREQADTDPLDVMVRLAGATLMGAAGALRKAADEIAPRSQT